MRNRYLVLGFASFLAVAMAVPALGGPSNPIATTSASALKVAKKAKQKATQAQTTADTALNSATTANNTANQARTTANQARTEAMAAQTTANSAQAAANAAQTTANSKYDQVDWEEGASSPSDAVGKGLLTAPCAAGYSDVTGGGWSTLGDADDMRIDLNVAYVNSWAIIADDAGAEATNWSVAPSVVCIKN